MTHGGGRGSARRQFAPARPMAEDEETSMNRRMTALIAAIAALGVTALLALARAFLGPTIYDRVLAVNMTGTVTVLLIAAIGFAMGRPEFLDIALVYALINFIGVVAVLKLVEHGNFHTAGESPNDPSGEQ